MVLTTSDKKCQKCNEPLPDNAAFCPACGRRTKFVLQPLIHETLLGNRSERLTAGAFLLLISACISLVSSLVAIDYIFSQGWLINNFSISVSVCASVLLVIMFGLMGFGFGVASGINTFRRKQFIACLMGSIVLIVQGVLNFITLYVGSNVGIHYVIFFGVPVITLSGIGLAFIFLRRKEFQ